MKTAILFISHVTQSDFVNVKNWPSVLCAVSSRGAFMYNKRRDVIMKCRKQTSFLTCIKTTKNSETHLFLFETGDEESGGKNMATAVCDAHIEN